MAPWPALRAVDAAVVPRIDLQIVVRGLRSDPNFAVGEHHRGLAAEVEQSLVWLGVVASLVDV